MVNIRLYISGDVTSPAGVSSSRRIIIAKKPPSAKKAVIDARYKSAMRLWSFVNSHDAAPCPLFR